MSSNANARLDGEIAGHSIPIAAGRDSSTVRRSRLPALLSMTFVACFGCAERERPDRPAAIPVVVGDVALNIPEPYLLGSRSELGRLEEPTGRYSVPSIRVIGSAPDFGNVDDGDSSLDAPGLTSSIKVHIKSLGPGVTAAEALTRIRKRSTPGEIIAQSEARDEQHVTVRTAGTYPYGSPVADIFTYPDGTFVVCNTKYQVVNYPTCETTMAFGQLIVSIRFGRNWIDRRRPIADDVIEVISRWTV